MKRIVSLFLMPFFVCTSILAQVTAESEFFQMAIERDDDIETLTLSQTFCDSVVLDSSRTLEGLSLTGKIIQPEQNSFVRILLQDKKGEEYIVLETNKLYNDVDTIVLNNYCEDTKYLPDVNPCLLLIYKNNASVDISYATLRYMNETLTTKYGDRKVRQTELFNTNRFKQAQVIANNINENNIKHHRLWRAEVTDLSLLSWENRKNVLGIDGRCSPSGFEYYSSGIFELGESEKEQYVISSKSSPYVDSFDWRNRHGINWMTSVKHQQHGGGCWAFTAIGVTEALVNLYYNTKIDYDLSEQEVISCSGCGSNANGGWADLALDWISSHGVSEETAFPFSDSDEPCSNKGSYTELLKINGTSLVNSHTINNNDSVKKALIKYGPLASGFRYNNGTYHGHAMVLVGYSTLHEGDTIRYFGSYYQNPNNFDVIQSGDPRIGRTYWIFKNSYGTDRPIEHKGYAYVLFNDQDCFLTPYNAKVPISSQIYSNTDIAVTDNDGDGYYFWGLGQKPTHCPSWVPDEPDGDDHDYAMGPMNEYGILYNLASHVNDIVNITSNTIWIQKRYIYNNIVIPNGVTLTIKNDVVFYNGAKITLRGGFLHIDGGHLYNANVDVDSSYNSNFKISHGGIIDKASTSIFKIPLGTVFEMNNGFIE